MCTSRFQPLRNKGRHGLIEDVDGSSLPADSQRVGGQLALCLHSSEKSDLCLSAVCVS